MKPPAVWGLDTPKSTTEDATASAKEQDKLQKINDESSSDEQTVDSETPSESDSSSSQKITEGHLENTESSTMRPFIKSAYEALKGYLDRERHLRQVSMIFCFPYFSK